MLILAVLPSAASTSFEVLPISSRQEAMCGIGTTGDANCLWLNPAAPTSLESPSVTFTHRRLWSLPELSVSSLAYAHRFGRSTVSAGLSSYGFAHYKESVGCVSWACRFDHLLDIGINLKWMQRSIARSAADGVVSVDSGLLMRPVEGISIDMSMRNLNGPTVGIEPLPQVLAAGLVYAPAAGLQGGISLAKQARHPLRLSIGEEFLLSEWLVQRAGVTRSPTQMSFGFGVHMSRLYVDYATVIHPTLGMTHSVSVSVVGSNDG